MNRLAHRLLEGAQVPFGGPDFELRVAGRLQLNLHVVAPIESKLDWARVEEFTRLVAVFLVRAEPGLFVAEMSKAKRSGRVRAAT